MAPNPVQLREPFFAFEDWRHVRGVRTGATNDLDEAKSMVDRHRRLDCKEYDRCLGKAAAEGWRGFTCKECTAYEHDPHWLMEKAALPSNVVHLRSRRKDGKV